MATAAVATGAAALQVLAASATRGVNGEWQLTIDSKEESFDKVEKFGEFVTNLSVPNGHELVLFIRVSVTRDDFLVFVNKAVPERNLLDSLVNRSEVERRVFFLLYAEDRILAPSIATIVGHAGGDPKRMKGITLYRLDLNSQGNSLERDLFPLIEIRTAAGLIEGTTKPGSPVDFCKSLGKSLNQNSAGKDLKLPMQMAMVPSGRSSASNESTSSTTSLVTNYAVLLVIQNDNNELRINVETEQKLFRSFCNRIAPLHLSIAPTENSDAKGVIEILTEMAKDLTEKIKASGEAARLWLIVSAHGNSDGIMIKSNPISVKKLTEPFFKAGLKAIPKVLILDVCRGGYPTEESDNSSKFGLMFRNEDGEDPWSVSDRPRCLTLFGSLPGFQAYSGNNKGLRSTLLRAMKNAAKQLQSPEELHEFVQRIQRCVDTLRAGKEGTTVKGNPQNLLLFEQVGITDPTTADVVTPSGQPKAPSESPRDDEPCPPEDTVKQPTAQTQSRGDLSTEQEVVYPKKKR